MDEKSHIVALYWLGPVRDHLITTHSTRPLHSNFFRGQIALTFSSKNSKISQCTIVQCDLFMSALFVLLCLYNSCRATQWEMCHWSVPHMCVCVCVCVCACVRSCVCVSRRSNVEATSPFPSAKRTAAQAPEQPGRQSLLQPSQREFKAFHGSLCLTLFPDDNTIKATCARPPSPHPHAVLLSPPCALALYLLLSCEDVSLHGE